MMQQPTHKQTQKKMAISERMRMPIGSAPALLHGIPMPALIFPAPRSRPESGSRAPTAAVDARELRHGSCAPCCCCIAWTKSISTSSAQFGDGCGEERGCAGGRATARLAPPLALVGAPHSAQASICCQRNFSRRSAIVAPRCLPPRSHPSPTVEAGSLPGRARGVGVAWQAHLRDGVHDAFGEDSVAGRSEPSITEESGADDREAMLHRWSTRERAEHAAWNV